MAFSSKTSFSFGNTNSKLSIALPKANLSSNINTSIQPVASNNVNIEFHQLSNPTYEKKYSTSASTACVICTSAISGVEKFGERLVDGGANVVGWIGSGVCQLFEDDETASRIEDKITKFISRDLTEESKQGFYENTEFGQKINEASKIKYDSDIASGIQSVSETVTTLAAETAISLVPGGQVIAAGIGATHSMGKTAEMKYQQGQTMKESAVKICVDGIIGGVEGYLMGKSGAKTIKDVKNIKVSQFFKSKTNLVKSTWETVKTGSLRYALKNSGAKVLKKSIVSVLRSPKFYIQTGTSILNECSSALDSRKWTSKNTYNVLLKTGYSFVTNTATTFVSDIFSESYKITGNYITKEDDFNRNYVKDSAPKLDQALKNQYNKLVANGYDKDYEDFVIEYSRGSFTVDNPITAKTNTMILEEGAVGELSGDSLKVALTYEGIGYGDSSDKVGGSWTTNMSSNTKLSSVSNDLDYSRQAKGITINDSYIEQGGKFEIHYSSDFCKNNSDYIRFNTGPSNIIGSSSAAMPGGFTYDLSGKGNGVPEVLMPRIEFSSSDSMKLSELVDTLTPGDKIDLASYGVSGVEIIRIS